MKTQENRSDLWGAPESLVPLTPVQIRFFLVVAVFTAGNLLFPALVHAVPDGGRLLLPIEFFTLIAAWRYGLAAGFTTALLSPLVNHLLTGMPALMLLPSLMTESGLLAVLAAAAARRSSRLNLGILAAVVVSTQVLGFLADLFLVPRFEMAVQGLLLGIPGMGLQVIGGYLVLKLLSRQSRV